MDKILQCPECGQKLADWIEKKQQFKIRSKGESQSQSRNLFQLPVRVLCNNTRCNKEFKIETSLEEELFCYCKPTKKRLIASPYTAVKRSGVWVSIHLPYVQTIDCSDAKINYHGKLCPKRFFLKELMENGKILGTYSEIKSEQTKFKNGSMILTTGTSDKEIDDMV